MNVVIFLAECGDVCRPSVGALAHLVQALACLLLLVYAALNYQCMRPFGTSV
jgi:hypothetical protein